MSPLLGEGRNLAGRVGDEAYFVRLCFRSGLFGLERPSRLAKLAVAFERYGMLASPLTIGAVRNPDRVVVRDELGDLTYRQLDERSNALANAWRQRGLRAGDGVAILARNHRGFMDAVFAAAKCGARIVLLNTSFAGPQIREVATREGTDLLVYDDEYGDMLEGVNPPRGRWRAWTDRDPTTDRDSATEGNRATEGDSATDGNPPTTDTLEALIRTAPTTPPPKPATGPRLVILTSGTTGTPKGAPRSSPRSLSLIGGLLSKVPFRAGEVTEMCAPMFHSLGFALMELGLALGSTLVMRRRFEPEATLDSLERNRATAMIMVPVMLQRLLDLGDDALAARDTSSLRIIFVSGSQLGGELFRRALRAFGPVVYNLYGSTEVSYATIATPKDLLGQPGTVGGVVRGSIVKIFDDDGNEVPAGVTGRIFVGNQGMFEGYTGGGSKDQIDGLLSSGDVGHFDDHGLLFVDGRDDEMIVSGGENVFPAEVEELLASHEAVAEAAVIGVDDEQFGQRLKAFVALRDGRRLTEDEAKQYVHDNLASYKTPREVVFIDELPRNPTGKVLKRELAASGAGSAARAPATSREDGER